MSTQSSKKEIFQQEMAELIKAHPKCQITSAVQNSSEPMKNTDFEINHSDCNEYFQNAASLDLVIDKDIQNCTPISYIRDSKYDAMSGSQRQNNNPAAQQTDNLYALIKGGNADGMGTLPTSRNRVDRPIYVWRTEDNKRIIVDGIKSYQIAKINKLVVKVVEIKFADVNEARAWRWYVNVAATCQLHEDARIWAFLQDFDWLIDQWRHNGRRNQSRKNGVFLKSEKVNWRQLAANLCQTTKCHMDSVFTLRQESEKVAALTPEQRDNLTPEEIASIKILEDGINAVLSGARSASSVVSNIKGLRARTGKIGKGKVNQHNKSNSASDGSISSVFDPRAESQLILGDSLELMGKLPIGAFKYLIGSPPYYRANLDYGFNIPWLKSWEDYKNALEKYIREAYRIIPEGGGIILNVADTRDSETSRYYYHHRLIQDICLSLGMYDAGLICWSKQNVSGKKHPKGSIYSPCLRPNHEFIVAFFKGKPKLDFPSFVFGELNQLTLSTWVDESEVENINADHWAAFTNYWEIAPGNSPEHPAVYPPKLAYRMLTRYTGVGDIVCDPWTGTGTTAVQCIMTGRRYFGIEYGKGYAEIAAANIRKAKNASKKLSVDRLLNAERYMKNKFVTLGIKDEGKDTCESKAAVHLSDRDEVEQVIAHELGGKPNNDDSNAVVITGNKEETL